MSKTISTASLLARLGLGIALLAPMAARALELGHLDLHSALGQRLKADIPLDFSSPPDLKRVRVGLASQNEFAGAGLVWTSMLGHIHFHTVRRHGAYFIELRSSQPITQPYLQFLLRIDWPGGRLLREYTALLDPPYLMKREEIATANAPSRQVTMPAAAPVVSPVVAPTTVAALSPPAQTHSAPLPLLGPPNVKPLAAAATTTPTTNPLGKKAPRTIGPLKSGESLWSVASQLAPREQAGVPQIALALFRANGSAFLRHNMNGVKRGAVLTVPSEAAVLSISRRQAVKALQVQTAAWDAYRAQMARHPLVVAAGSHPSGVASGQVASAGAGAHAPHELLKIVGAGAAGSLQGKTAREVLKQGTSSLQGALVSSQLENAHLAKQVQKLKQQLEATKRLLTIENRELAQLQVQFKGGKVALAPSAVLAHKATAGTLPKPVALPPKPVAAAHPPAVRKPRVMAPPPPVSMPQASLVDEVMASPLFVPLAGVLALLLAGLALYYRRRQQSIAEFEESILSGPVSEGASGTEDSGKQTDVSFLSDFSQGGMGNIHTDEVDPIAEAEVYLAYGRDEQAEEILKEAIQKDSMRHELRLRLLEIYSQRKDVGAFETTAEELYAALEGKGGRIWARAEELGRKLSPDNPLFRRQTEQETAGEGDTPETETVSASPLDLDTAVMETGMSSGTQSTALETDSGAKNEDSFSFSLDMPAFSSGTVAEPAAVETPAPGSAIADRETSVPAAGLNGLGPVTAEDGDMPAGGAEFDLDFMSTSPPSSEGLPVDMLKDLGVSPPASGDNLEWAVNTGGAEETEDRDDEGSGGTSAGASGEAGTKLDLAKAYIDMGDAEGARGILNEVLAEGDDRQKEEAHRLVATLS